MADMFNKFGIVMGVFIPARRDKRGKQNNFVRFKKVQDERLMANKLDSIHIKGRKIFANIYRFNRGWC
ncbi:unnamed protein product [Lathyrus sativus]|nr:unnamed protein product [Lathyrus sativus]